MFLAGPGDMEFPQPGRLSPLQTAEQLKKVERGGGGAARGGSTSRNYRLDAFRGVLLPSRPMNVPKGAHGRSCLSVLNR